MKPLSARQALDAYFLEARCKLLDVAALFDRIERGTGQEEIAVDPRWLKLQKALDLLAPKAAGERAQAVQELFSIIYDADWKIPAPRYEN
jgi:hypothetical protein